MSRALDAKIAEQVMGVEARDVRPAGEVDTPLVRVWVKWLQTDGCHDRYTLNLRGGPLPYSEDIRLAFQVVEAMRAKGYGAHMQVYRSLDPQAWRVQFPTRLTHDVP